MRALNAIEIYRIAKEIEKKVVKGYLKKIYRISENEFILSFQELFIFIALPKAIFATQYKENETSVDTFTSLLRKHLINKRLDKIDASPFDRKIIFRFGEYSLLIELYGKGNIALIKDRDVIASLNNTNIDMEFKEAKEIEKTEGKEKIIKEIINAFNIGTRYIEEILLELGIDPNSKIVISKEIIEKIKERINYIIENVEKLNVIFYYEINDFYLIEINKYKNYKKEIYNSLNELLDSLYIKERLYRKSEEKEEKIRSIKETIKRLEDEAKELEKNANEYEAIGNAIYQNLYLINNIILDARKNTLKESYDNIKVLSFSNNKRLELEVE